MMGRALLLLGLLATAGLVAAAALGYEFGAAPRKVTLAAGTDGDLLRAHVLVALAACLVLLFSHSWILLYLLATGRVVAQLVRDNELEGGLAERSRRLRIDTLPWLALALATALATFLLGSAAFSGTVPAGVHHALFYLTLGAQARALWVESRVLRDHHLLMADVGRRLASDAA